MSFQMFVCINYFPQFTPFLPGLFKSVRERFYCNKKSRRKEDERERRK
jgi:hypothetical protein